MDFSANMRRQEESCVHLKDLIISNHYFIKQLMRISALVIIVTLTTFQALLATSTKGQDMRIDKVTMGLRDESLNDALKKIERQTNLRFYYHKADIKMFKSMSLSGATRTVEQTLTELLKNSVLTFRQIEGNILLEQNQQVEYEIKGRLLNELHEPVPSATIRIIKAGVDKTIQTTQSDLNGYYNLLVKESGEYIIKVSAIGIDSLSVGITLNATKIVQLPDYILFTSKNQLKEVVITGSKPLIKQEIDRITYDVQRDPDNLTSNALEIMRKVPLLSVDGEDNLRLQGGSDYRIMIDGKPSSLLLRNPKDVLKSFPATSILSIEVITTPPSKYDSEGIAGIINIITKKRQANGYSGSINISEKIPVGGPTGSLSIALKRGKFSASAFGGAGYFNQPEIAYSRNRITSGASPTNLIQSGLRSNHNWFSYFDSEYSYELDSLNLMTAEVGFNKGKNHSSDAQLSTLNALDNTMLLQEFTVDNITQNRWDGIDLGLDYQHGFKKSKNDLFTLSYKFRETGNQDIGNITTTNRTNYNRPDFNQVNNSGSYEHTAQVDYTFSLKKIKTEAGVKGIFRNNNSKFAYNSFDAKTGNFTNDRQLSNSFENYQNVYSAYNAYTFKINNLGLKLGYRLEKTFVSGMIFASNVEYKTNYTSLIPSLSINYNFKNQSNINFGFTQRVQRPNIWVLNPYVDRSNANYEITGNPNLDPVRSNNFQIRYNPTLNGTLILGAFYSFANNAIQEISTFDATRQVTSVTYANLGKDKNIGITFNSNYPLSKQWTLNSNFNVRHVRYEGIINNILTANSGIVGSAYIGSSFKLTKSLNINGNFNYASRSITLQTKTNAYASFTVGVNKELIKSKLIISTAVSNPFTKFRNSTNITTGNYFTQIDESQLYFRSFTLSLNYRFGKLEDKVKRTKKSINNDDVIKVPEKTSQVEK
jgi:outer membrane receptor protein involved in Fe transport